LDSYRSSFRADCAFPTPRQQHHPACVSRPSCTQGKKALILSDSRWLLWFSTRSKSEELQRLINTRKFEATLKPRLDREVENFHQQQELIDPAPQPIIELGAPSAPDAPPDSAAALGGEMRIRSPWTEK